MRQTDNYVDDRDERNFHVEDAPPRYRWQEPNDPWAKRYGKKLAGGIACSFAVYFFMHVGFVVGMLRWTCEIGGRVLGRPGTAVKLDHLEERLAHAIDKGKDAIHEHEGERPKMLATLVAPVRQAMEVKKTVEEVKEKAEVVKEKIADGVQTIHDTGEKVASAFKAAGTQATAAVGGTVASLAGLAQAKAEARDKAAKEGLEAHLDTLGIKRDPNWTLPRLRAEVLKAEIEWQKVHGPNARCPRKGCKYAFRIKSKRAESWRCPLCGVLFTTRQALAAGAAAMPKSIHIYER